MKSWQSLRHEKLVFYEIKGVISIHVYKRLPWTRTWASWNQSTLSHPISLISVITQQSPTPNVCLGLPSSLLFWQNFVYIFQIPHASYMNECIRGGPFWPLSCDFQWPIYCASPFLFSPLSIIYFEWNAELCLWGHHLVP